MPNLRHISKGNSKTECFSFDIPAIETCPGSTEECRRDCYAANLMRIYKAVDAKYARNLEFCNSNRFVGYMVREIPANCQFRIHVSGDFQDAAYVRKWITICQHRPDVTFYAYTRSWRIVKMWKAILQLHALPNVNVNLSVDDETGAPTIFGAQELRWCYLTRNDMVPDWMRRDDIVFRSNHVGHKKRRKNDEKKGLNPDNRSPIVKRLGFMREYQDKTQVCPLEQGRDIPNLSCAKCRLCVDKPKVGVYA